MLVSFWGSLFGEILQGRAGLRVFDMCRVYFRKLIRIYLDMLAHADPLGDFVPQTPKDIFEPIMNEVRALP